MAGENAPALPGEASEPLPAATFLPLRPRYGWTVAVLISVIAADLFVIGTEIAFLGELGPHPADALFDRINVEGSDVARASHLTGIVSAITFPAYIGAVVAFIMWFSRAYRNLPALGARNPRFGFGSAVWSWFVPIFNFIRPKQIANDIWRASDPDDLGPSWRERPVSPLLHWWWAIWIGGALIASPGLLPAALSGGETVADQRTLTTGGIVTSSLDIVAAILAIFVVRAITEREERRALRSMPPGG